MGLKVKKENNSNLDQLSKQKPKPIIHLES